MAEYKIVYRRTVDREGSNVVDWRPLCPVLVEAVQVVRRKSDAATYLQIRLMNISQRTVVNINGVAVVSLHDGRSLTVGIAQLDWDCAPGESQPLKAMEIESGDVDGVRLDIVSVRFRDGGDWVAPGEDYVPLALAPLQLSPTAQEERQAQLRDHGVHYRDGSPVTGRWKVLEGDGWWVCPCGQPNNGDGTCCMCKTTKTTWVALQNQELLEKVANQRRRRAEADAAKREDERREQKRKRGREAKIWGRGAVIVIAVLICAIALWKGFGHLAESAASKKTAEEVAAIPDEVTAEVESELDGILTGKNASSASVLIHQYAQAHEDDEVLLHALAVGLVDRAQTAVDDENLAKAKTCLGGLANTPFWGDERVRSAITEIRNNPTDPMVYAENLPAIVQAVKGVSS